MNVAGSNEPLGPDFFIVGAPKCGTTALDAYLSEHPQIFMGRKEQHFFGSDLSAIWTHPDAGWRPSPDEYFGMFGDSRDAKRRGESSVWYLWSRRAASEIYAYKPTARIIAMVRNPVEMLPSLHSQYLYDSVEVIADFAGALAAEQDRRHGRRIPRYGGSEPWRLFYRDVVRFYEQVERYFTVFGRHQVRVVLFDDFVNEPQRTYERTLAFLDVDKTFAPDFRVVNPNKRIRSRRLQHTVWSLCDPSSRLRRAGTRLIPVHGIRSALLQRSVPTLRRMNTAVESRQPIDPAVKAELAAELAPDIDRLGDLIGRDLSRWYQAAR
jgi:hypothetical protein